ncbi:meprin A subunit beta-like [Aplochiton taeniatus]
MHYGKDAFSNGNGSTIITKDPVFQDVIGQRLDMSPNDVLKLNRLYECNSTIAFKEFCSFSDETICGMSSCAQNKETGWQRVAQAVGGPSTDHTNLPTQNATSSPVQGFFMHVSTIPGQQGDSSWLWSRKMSPTRKCSVQCLQFYYFHNGDQSDQLNIWIREFQDDKDSTGKLRLMGQITGPPTSHWLLHHVPLDASKSFQVEFEVRKGAGNSSGGFSIDDINLSETECPHQTWQIRDFLKRINASNSGSFIYSPRYYSPEGYAYQVAIQTLGDRLRLFVRLVSGEYDDHLQWPCAWRQVTFISLDQNPNIQLQMSRQRSLTTNPNETTSAG